MKKITLSLILILTIMFTTTVNFDAASRPEKVKGVTTASIGKKTVTLKWKKAKRAKYYQIYKITKTYRSHGKTKYKYKKVGTTKKRTFKIKNLKPGKKYKFRLRAVRGKEKGKLSKIKVVTTKKKTATINYDLKISIKKKSDNSFVIEWSKITGASSYELKVYDCDRDKTIKTITTKNTSYTVTNIQAGTYKVYITVNGDYYIEESKTFKLENAEVTQYSLPSQTEMNQLSKQLADKINAERKKNGLSTLKWDNELSAIAMERAKECAEIGNITHNLPKLKSPDYSLRVFNYHNYQQYITYDEDGVPMYSADYPGIPGVAENMYGYGYDLSATLSENTAGMHQGYMDSSGHKKNILHSKAIAVGIATYIDVDSYDNGYEFITVYNVEMFELSN